MLGLPQKGQLLLERSVIVDDRSDVWWRKTKYCLSLYYPPMSCPFMLHRYFVVSAVGSLLF